LVGGIFINYRGEDSDTAAALIDRELTARFGSDRVFLDCRSIPAGADFVEELLGRLRACSVLLVVIGPRWLTLTDAAGQRRIDDPRDWIRWEIVEALSRGMRIIPVLTGDIRLPVEADLPGDIVGLSRRQYVPLRRRYAAVDLAFLVQRITEADPELAKIAARRQSSAGQLPQHLPAAFPAPTSATPPSAPPAAEPTSPGPPATETAGTSSRGPLASPAPQALPTPPTATERPTPETGRTSASAPSGHPADERASAAGHSASRHADRTRTRPGRVAERLSRAGWLQRRRTFITAAGVLVAAGAVLAISATPGGNPSVTDTPAPPESVVTSTTAAGQIPDAGEGGPGLDPTVEIPILPTSHAFPTVRGPTGAEPAPAPPPATSAVGVPATTAAGETVRYSGEFRLYAVQESVDLDLNPPQAYGYKNELAVGDHEIWVNSENARGVAVTGPATRTQCADAIASSNPPNEYFADPQPGQFFCVQTSDARYALIQVLRAAVKDFTLLITVWTQ